MVDTVNISTLRDANDRYVIHFTNEGDGTGESNVIKVNLSNFVLKNGSAPTSSRIMKITYSGGSYNYVVLRWDHTTDDEIAVLSGNGELDFKTWGGKGDPGSAGDTGDILLTTDGNVDGAHYDILLDIVFEA